MRVLILLVLIGVAVAVPKQRPQRIVGGEQTSIEEYPYMSSMMYTIWGVWFYQGCGGSLLTSRTVLSASHCYIGELPSTWRVRLGSSYPENGGTIHNVLELITHEEYDSSTIDNDVAIVVLSTPAVFSDTIGVARIAGTNYNLPDDTLVTVIGYGVLWAGGPSPDHLRHVDVNLINQELCVERYAYLKSQPGYEAYPDVTDGMLCSGILDVGGKDACQGDSGGPLVHAGDIVVGVTSWGAGCANGTYPGVNARVSKYADWIVRHASV